MSKKQFIGSVLLSTTVLTMVAGCSNASQQQEATVRDRHAAVTTPSQDLENQQSENDTKLANIRKQVQVFQSQTVSADTLDKVSEVVSESKRQDLQTGANLDDIRPAEYQKTQQYVEPQAPVVQEQPVTDVTPAVEDIDITIVEDVQEDTVVADETESDVISDDNQEVEPVQEDVQETGDDVVVADEEQPVDSADEVSDVVEQDNTLDDTAESEDVVSEPEVPVESQEPVVEESEAPSENVVEQTSVESQESTPEVVQTAVQPSQNYSANTYPVGQCTWGVKEVAPWVGNYWGNGADWAQSASNAGYYVSSTPAVGTVASWNDGGYGHVAYVTNVDEQTGMIQVLEANYAGNQAINNYRGWFDPTTCQGQVSYIYNQLVA